MAVAVFGIDSDQAFSFCCGDAYRDLTCNVPAMRREDVRAEQNRLKSHLDTRGDPVEGLVLI